MSKYAYVTVLYKTNVYFAGAIVLGHSLKKTNTKYDRIIMTTNDVSLECINILKQIFTYIIPIDYISAHENIFQKTDSKFLEVFTKFQALSLTQYSKIILLDTDMIITKNIDHLFSLKPPAACLKNYNIKYGAKIDKKFICKYGRLINTINAGLMLLKPDSSELAAIKNDILNSNQLHKFKYPEQDYISLRYCAEWHSITFNYNYQFGLTRRVSKLKYNADKIYVIHYSSSHKPWNYLIPHYAESPKETSFQSIHKKYYDLWINIYKSITKKRKLKITF